MELVSALNEPGTLDELGIGSVRDTIAEFLFPGTSTIQTRARYFLFIPWILQRVEAAPGGNSDRRARELQLRLCDALDRSHGSGAGVIGRQARGSLRRWPSSIYWVGLERWGIRREVASRAPFEGGRRGRPTLREVTRAPADPVEDFGYESGDTEPGRWAKLPQEPEDFPDKTSFELTPEEGRFLRTALSSGTLNLTWLISCEKGRPELSGTRITRGSTFRRIPRLQRWRRGLATRGWSL